MFALLVRYCKPKALFFTMETVDAGVHFFVTESWEGDADEIHDMGWFFDGDVVCWRLFGDTQ